LAISQIKITFARFQKYNLVKAFHKIINAYTKRFGFPHRGLKYFLRFLRIFHLDNEKYQKKIHKGLLINVSPRDHIQRQLFWYGHYEKEAFLLAEKLIREDAIVLDIGANIGYFSLIAARKASRGKVIAFEPLSSLRHEISQNILLNKLVNLEVEPYAIGNQTRSTTFFIADESNIGMSGLAPQENFSGATEQVSLIRLDEWLSRHTLPAINFIKIDTEGAELEVLKGMKDLLQKNRPVILIEVMAHLLLLFGNSPGDLYSFLDQFQYTPYLITAENILRRANQAQENYSVLFLPPQFQLPAGISIEMSTT
jgi:FkbM family methyltransferase